MVLPRVDGIQTGTALRIKLTLPDRSVLYLSGTADNGIEDGVRNAPDRIPVRLNPFTDEQVQTLEACVAAAAPEPIEDAPSGIVNGERRLNLLLVDDSVTVRIELGDALRERGLRVRVAENGLVAIAAALKRPPDLILSDVEMPTMDGWTFLRMTRARKRLAHIPFVFFTKLDDEVSRLQGYRMGVEDYLRKDTQPDEILARLEGVMARRGTSAPEEQVGSLRGDLEHVRLGSLLAFLEQEGRTGALHLRNGHEESTLLIARGRLKSVDGLGGYVRPEDRVFEMLDWHDGEFEFQLIDASGEDVDGFTRLSYLLMEHARRVDEQAS